MSGHSHWATIKHKKGAEDEKRGKIFSKMARIISITAKEGGNPEMNSKLRQAIEEARKVNMPKDNIERAIKKGTGEIKGDQLEEIAYEALGPENINLIIEIITDNKNRTLGEIKQILQKHNYKIADEGSVRWAFEKKGLLVIKIENNKEALELKAIEAGAEEIEEIDNFLEIQTRPEELDQEKKTLDVDTETSTLIWQAKEEIDVSQKVKISLEKLFEDLNDNDAIQEIYSNLRL